MTRCHCALASPPRPPSATHSIGVCSLETEGPYRLYGHIGSPYSMKLRAILRYRRLPHIFIDDGRELSRVQGLVKVRRLDPFTLDLCRLFLGVPDSINELDDS